FDTRSGTHRTNSWIPARLPAAPRDANQLRRTNAPNQETYFVIFVPFCGLNLLYTLEYHRRGGITFQRNRLRFVIEDDLAHKRCLAFSRSFGVDSNFDQRELVVRCSPGCDRFPACRATAQAAIRREDDPFAAIRQPRVIGVLNRITHDFVRPKISDSWCFTQCNRQRRNRIRRFGIFSIAAATTSTASSTSATT